MAKDDFKAHVVGFEYSNIDGTGWPDSVELENGKPFMVDGDINDEYEQRTYYPVDVKALLALADELSSMRPCEVFDRRGAAEISRRIREALGASDG